MSDTTSGTTPVTDHRVAPRGVLPRHMQMWLMVAVAIGILAIIVLTGHSEPTPPTVTTAPMTPADAPVANLRDYSARLRLLDDRAREQLGAQSPQATPTLPQAPSSTTLRQTLYDAPTTTATPDPLSVERQRREYDSLFASNVVVSRRPSGQNALAGAAIDSRGRAGSAAGGLPPPPTIDEVAQAVVRASQLATPAPAPSQQSGPSNAALPSSAASPARPIATGPISSVGPLHPVLEGTVIDAVLTNRLDGSAASPVNCLVTNPVYSHDGRYVLIPAGARVLGETKPVQAFGDTRLAVSFNRLLMPDGRTYRLDQFMGLNGIGDAGLRDQVNQHYKSTFGASAAVGLISGFAQYLGTAGFNRGNGDRTVIVTGGVSDAAAQSTAQVMNRYLNRPPNITIREGHRVKVYVTSDFELPPYRAITTPGGPLLANVQ